MRTPRARAQAPTLGYFVAPMGEVPRAESAIAIAVFATVYLGMLAGRLPRLALDRTGIALLGAIVLVATGASSLERATAAIDAPTILLLFGLMVVSAQLRLGGFYARTANGLASLSLQPVAGDRDRLAGPCTHRRAGDPAHAGAGGPLAGVAGAV